MRYSNFGACLLVLSTASIYSFGQSDIPDRSWTEAWGAAPSAIANGVIGDTAQTIREVIRASTGGRFVRIKISNDFGTKPLRIGRASVALRDIESTVQGTPVPLTFNGRGDFIVDAGQSLTSDAASLDVPALSDVAVSLFIPRQQKLDRVTVHWFANTTNYVAPGEQVLARALTNSVRYQQWPFLAGLEVKTLDEASGAVVCLGDSITAGFRSTPDANDRWTDELASRLQANRSLRQIGVINEGIPGNRVLSDGLPRIGPSAISRFDRDVLSQANAKFVIILEGINDIGGAYGPQHPDHSGAPTAEDLVAAYTKMAEKAHARGMRVIGATLTPFGNARYFSEAGDMVRQKVNSWIRTTAVATRVYDGVVDFDQALRTNSSEAFEVLKPPYDSGDHLHPNDAGYKAMGDAIDLRLFSH